MIGKLLDSLFGCRHKSITRPTTPKHKADTKPEETYVACLQCGQRFQYDLTAMRIGRPLPTDSGGGQFQR